MGRILSTRFSPGDILVVLDETGSLDDFPSINLPELAEKYQIPYDWFTNSLLHCNHLANQIWADELFHMMLPTFSRPITESGRAVYFSKDMYLRYTYLNKYFFDLALFQYARIGAIVMNCNPFTKGHRYLIEESLKYVDFLIIFVVEEDRSLFSFSERFAMVSKGTEDLKHVKVVPGGAFILTQTTFPEYFIKIKDEDITVNTDYDITLFAEHIATPLGIMYRFVGEEPEDEVTAEYNNSMKRILPKYGIRLIEIPRSEQNGQVVSASNVRALLENEKLAEA